MALRCVVWIVPCLLIHSGLALRPPLLRWLEAMPGVEHNVRISTFGSNERELLASRDLAPSDVVAKIPLSTTLQINVGDNYTEEVEDSWAGSLAAKLWMESIDPLSTLRPYFTDGLPRNPPSVLCRWTQEEREALQNTTLLHEIELNDQWRLQQFHQFGGDCGEEDFLVLLDLVCSRTLFQSSTRSRFLVPLIDLANHAPTEANGGRFIFDEANVYLLAGSRGVKRDQPIYLDYGGRTIDDFLMHYGFCPDRCQTDAVSLPNGKSISWLLASTLAVDDPESAQLCKMLLNVYPTSLEDDLNELRHASGRPFHEMALRYRIAKKSLLKSAAGFPPYQS